MPNHSSLAVANAFSDLAGYPLPRMKLQKLVYIAHGWNLAISDTPLVAEKVQAWEGGPVFRSLYEHMRDWGHNLNGKSFARPFTEDKIEGKIDVEESMLIKEVWKRYHKYSGTELSGMTHQPGTPWTWTYFNKGQNGVIPNDLIKSHFTELAMSGRLIE